MPGVILRNSKVPVIPYDTETLSSSRITSQLICPSRCTNVPMPWLCETCGAPVFFSLSDWCYCYCGKYNVNAAEYRCNEPGHELATPTDLAVPLEKYNIAVICKARELRTKWLTWVIDPTEPIGCPYATYEVRQAQRLFRFVDLTHEHDLKEFHAVCIVTPFYGNIRPHLFEAVAVLGKKAVKNVFVYSPGEPVPAQRQPRRPRDGHGDAGRAVLRRARAAQRGDSPRIPGHGLQHGPLERQLMDTPPTPEEAQNLALGLKDFCQLIGKTLTTNIDCLEHDRSSRRKAFVLTSSFLRPKLVPQLFEVGADSTGDTIEEDEFQAKILVGCTMKEMDPEAAREELERLEESKAFFEMVERQLDFCLKFTIQDEAGVELILRLKDDMLASRYREEALEYLNAATRPSKGSVLSYVVRCQSNSLLPLPKMCPNALVEEEITTSSSLDSNFGSPRKLRGGRRRRARGGRNRGRGGRNRRSRLPDCSSC
ncbi:hypothetical protein L596_028423 [Steinernema carpocapsae]|uniref:Uncharacterized protein n=1 Tax=Steinernema carpocapsae TaxID=34508 RepID=A0A4U5LYE2_STECR|nr:hypothetical protein L596_028423 [Steinernema carpocapsae]